MHGQPPGRPSGPSTEYPRSHSRSRSRSHTLSIPDVKIDHWLSFKKGMSIIWRVALIPYLESRSLVDFTQRKRGLWGLWSRPSPGSDFMYRKNLARPRSGFYLHKEFRAAEIRILSTQRISRGRGPILSTQTFYGACFKKHLLRKMSAILIVKIFPRCARLFLTIYWEQWVMLAWHTKQYGIWCVVHIGDDVDENGHF